MTVELSEKLRSGARTVGYWVLSDNPQAVERIAGTGYDYVCFDAQHGLLEYRALLDGLTALDACGGTGRRGPPGGRARGPPPPPRGAAVGGGGPPRGGAPRRRPRRTPPCSACR